MKKINSLQQIRKILDQRQAYVRWSRSFSLDRKRGYSLRYGSQAEAGLSACELGADWPDWKLLQRLQEYQFCGGECRLLNGEVVGYGGDNEPLLSDAEQVAVVDRDWLLSNDWALAWRDEFIASEYARFERMRRMGNEPSAWELGRIEKLRTDDPEAIRKIYYS